MVRPVRAQLRTWTFNCDGTITMHKAWDKLLAAYVVPGRDGINRVRYARFKRDGRAALKAYVAALQKVSPAALARPDQFAFWANLYNATTIDIVLDKYPVSSIKKINLGGGLLSLVSGGPWKAKVVHVGFDDPPALAREARTEEQALDCYRRVRDEIRAFVETLPESLDKNG